jgi:hypothetical protein
MKYLLVICTLFFSGTSLLFAQFPDSWTGKYSGKMYLSNVSAPTDSVDVSLEIKTVHADSVWTFNMHYTSNRIGKIEKNYLIIRRNGKFIMDEGNGILIEMSYMNDAFYEFYTVEGMMFSTTMRKTGDSIFFEIYGASEKPTLSTESAPDENSKVYKVNSNKPTFAQSVLLKPLLKD